MKTIDVVAAIILNQEKKVLIAKRGKHQTFEGKWEFPGGKIKENETHQQALERELLEELAIRTSTESLFMLNNHNYENFSIKLYAYYSKLIEGEIKLSDHDQVAWEEISNLKNYDFTEADIPIVEELIKLNS